MLPQSTRERWRLALVVLALLVVVRLIWAARAALYPFIVGIILAFVLAPMVDRVAGALTVRHTRPGLAMGLAVAYVYTTAVLLIVLLMAELLPRTANQGRDLADSVPALVATARGRFEQSASWYRERVPENVQREVDRNTQDLARRAGDVGVQMAERTLTLITGGVTNILSYVVVPFWLFYVLKDRDQGARTFYRLFPVSVQPDVRAMMHQANRVLGSYIRAQLLLSTVSGVITGVGLTLLGVKFSLILGVIAGVASLIPVLGPMIGGVPALIVTAATRPGPTVLWVFLFLFVGQNLKDYILVPRVQGQAVNIHPAIILPLLVVAGHVAGFWGLLVVVPVAAVLRDVFLHIYRRLGEAATDAEQPAEKPATGLDAAGDS